jgi:hypothetical protein
VDKKNVDKILPCESRFVVLKGQTKPINHERQIHQLVHRRHRMVGVVPDRQHCLDGYLPCPILYS